MLYVLVVAAASVVVVVGAVVVVLLSMEKSQFFCLLTAFWGCRTFLFLFHFLSFSFTLAGFGLRFWVCLRLNLPAT